MGQLVRRCMLVFVLMGAPTSMASKAWSAELQGAESLRAAIQDLADALGARYPDAREYLARLDVLEHRAAAANGMMVQSMRSGTAIRPGETTGCAGCHEDRLSGPPPGAGNPPMALAREPSELKPWHGPPREFNYLSEVQPVFDKHCVGCHDYGQEAGDVLNLAGDLGLVFNTSYLELRRKSSLRWFPEPADAGKRLVKVVDDGPPEVLPPYAWGSHCSKLVDVIRW